jgi:hypothetical protein
MGADHSAFAHALGYPQQQYRAVESPGSRPIEAFFSAAAAVEAEAYKKMCTDASTRVTSFVPSQTLSRGAQTSSQSTTNGHINLLIAALGHTTHLLVPPGDLTNPESREQAGLSIALIYGLLVWNSLSMPRPTHCKHCAASAVPAASDASRSQPAQKVSLAGSKATRIDQPRTRATLDDFGNHIFACNASGPLAGNKWRHDTICRRFATISAECGLLGRYHDGPIFDHGIKQRPADFLQRAPNPARYPKGEAVDPTFGLASARSAADRESEKVQKFLPQLRLHPQLAFRAFGATSDGDIGPQAHSIMIDWSRSLAHRTTQLQIPAGDPRGEVSVAVARSYVRAVINQLVQWKLHEQRRHTHPKPTQSSRPWLNSNSTPS